MEDEKICFRIHAVSAVFLRHRKRVPAALSDGGKKDITYIRESDTEIFSGMIDGQEEKP